MVTLVFPALLRRHAGGVGVGRGARHPRGHDAACPGARSQALAPTVRHRQVPAAEQLPGALRVGRATARRRDHDFYR